MSETEECVNFVIYSPNIIENKDILIEASDKLKVPTISEMEKVTLMIDLLLEKANILLCKIKAYQRRIKFAIDFQNIKLNFINNKNKQLFKKEIQIHYNKIIKQIYQNSIQYTSGIYNISDKKCFIYGNQELIAELNRIENLVSIEHILPNKNKLLIKNQNDAETIKRWLSNYLNKSNQ